MAGPFFWSFKLDLIPVALAARMVYQRAYGVSPRSCRRLRSGKLACGHFETAVGVSERCIEKVVDALLRREL